MPEQPLPASSQSTAPTLSVVITAARTFATVRRTVEHLAVQTIAEQIELLIVAPDAASLEAMPAELSEPFHLVVPVYVGPIDDVDKAMAPAIREARSAVIALVEDHVFPEPDWAEAIVAAHDRGDWAAVGSTVENANPKSPLSWANQLMSYGKYTPPVTAGTSEWVSRHNIAYKKKALEPHMAALTDQLGRGGDLLARLHAEGHTFYLEPAARVRHINPSRLGSTVQLRSLAGRLAAAGRAQRERWPWPRRLLYVGGAPLIPLMRFRQVADKVLAEGRWRQRPMLLPAVAGVLVLDAAGQTVGFLTGPGRAEQRLAQFEFDRMRHLTDHDRRTLAV